MTALATHRSYESLRESMNDALGTAWDNELEFYRLGIRDAGIAQVSTI